MAVGQAARWLMCGGCQSDKGKFIERNVAGGVFFAAMSWQAQRSVPATGGQMSVHADQNIIEHA